MSCEENRKRKRKKKERKKTGRDCADSVAI